MVQDIYDPLSEYINVFRARFADVAKETFAQMAKDANVDVDANRATCRQLYDTEENLSSVKTRITWWRVACVLLWLIAVGGGIATYILFETLEQGDLASIIVGALLSVVLLIAVVYPKLKKLKTERDDLATEVRELRAEAWQQMEPLNRLYDWDILTRMMTKTVPRLEFDNYFTLQRLADLKKVYNWDDSFNVERSVIYSHSGLINGNPFVICRTRKMNMGTKTYYGHKTIHWTTREIGSNGKYHTVYHTETLTASVTEPYPFYYEKTRVIYGNTAAPDLIFYRQQSGLAGKERSLTYKMKRRALRKKARDLSNRDFALMTNEEFETVFDTSNRNNNQQFALLFTPLAQESMIKLLKDKSVGYGDDFDFQKNKMINTIIPEHLQELNLDMNPDQYRDFDYDNAEKRFHSINAHYFRAIYFSLAPLLCVPMYQQIRSHEDIYGRDMAQHSAFWEHEALANFWGQNHFRHPSCVTDCILKTEQQKGLTDDDSTIKVYAYGFRSEQRVTYISKWGGDGRLHSVPVYWDEYLPVTGTGNIRMKEDNATEENSCTQRQRISHIHDVLNKADLNIYRRHIASKI